MHNTTRAFEAYAKHADLTGNATSQAILGFFYATGYDNVVEVNQAKSLLYYTFAAHGGDQGAQMTVGYRYWAGIGVNDECPKALEWYQTAAEQCMSFFYLFRELLLKLSPSNGNLPIWSSWWSNNVTHSYKAIRP